MMRRLFVVCLLLLCVLLPTSSHAQTETRNLNALPRDLAERMPPVDLFVALRTDEAQIDRLDALIFQITDALPDDVSEPLTLNDLINERLVPDLPLDIPGIVTNLIGDQVAIGVDLLDALADGVITEDDAVIIYGVAPIQDRTLVEATLRLSGLVSEATETPNAAYTVFDFSPLPRVIAVGDTHAYFVEGDGVFNPTPATTLADSADFNTTLATFSGEDYSAMFYGGTGSFIRDIATDPAIQEILAALGFNTASLGPLAFAAQINSMGGVFVDVVQARSGPPADLNIPVTPDFVGYIPGESEIFVHTTDINQLLNTASGLIASISGSTTDADIYAQFENLIAVLLGLDLQTEILPWASGDYGVFANISPMQSIADPLRIGAVLEVSDLQAAQGLIDAISAAIVRLSSDTPVSESRIVVAETGASVDAVIVELQDDILGTVEVAIGVYDTFLFVATYDMAIDLLNGGDSLLDRPAYTEAVTAYLPQAGLGVFIADRAPGAILRLGVDILDPLRVLLGSEAATIIVDNAPDFFIDLVSSSSISAVSTESGALMLRFAIMLEALPDGHQSAS